eukprot:CAMPEP_0181368180 /NCGR_PEP_ID=MMETSP1106-20121128/11917_1 /TAXON_ID=81844 /ORGANISM="Mantoniella antarctica, Strain SL-175" /LENGTH=58 /DNA_ID=CAMNT_0023484213 /DNA_START=636 /DNA_END=809 /DNA_ORIENTATION=+
MTQAVRRGFSLVHLIACLFCVVVLSPAPAWSVGPAAYPSEPSRPSGRYSAAAAAAAAA